MEVKKDTVNNVTCVSNVTKSGLRMHYTLPMAGSTEGQVLKIGKGKSTIRLTASQIKSLSRVIARGKRYAK